MKSGSNAFTTLLGNAAGAACLFDEAPTAEIYTLSLHDALPISSARAPSPLRLFNWCGRSAASRWAANFAGRMRSEEHTSELQSRFDLVCRLLLEKKK